MRMAKSVLWAVLAAGSLVACWMTLVGVPGALAEAERIVEVQPQPAPAATDGSVPKEGSGSEAEAAGTGDAVTTIQGDRLVGRVLGLDSSGRLRLVGPQFEGEVLLRMASVGNITLQCKESQTKFDEVAMTNGDRLFGDISGITPEEVVLDSASAGQLKLPRKMVSSLTFAKGKTALVDSDFSRKRMEPWVSKSGSWTFSGGGLTCSAGGENMIFAKVEQKEAITFEATVEAVSGNNLQCELIFFSDTTDSPYGRNSIFCQFNSYEWYMYYNTRNEGTNSVQSGRYGNRQIRSGTFRVSYDPDSGKATVWKDSVQLGEAVIPFKPNGGQFVMLRCNVPTKVTSIKVVQGVASPSSTEGKAEEKTDIIKFVNKDTLSSKSLALEAGQCTITTDYGEMKVPVGNITTVFFRKEGREEPRRQAGDVAVETCDGTFTLQLDKVTEEYLTGKSDALGSLQVRRNAVREVRFNIYK